MGLMWEFFFFVKLCCVLIFKDVVDWKGFFVMFEGIMSSEYRKMKLKMVVLR